MNLGHVQAFYRCIDKFEKGGRREIAAKSSDVDFVQCVSLQRQRKAQELTSTVISMMNLNPMVYCDIL